ncbi:ATP-binding protein [Halosimplex aquaticum]
MDPRYDDSDGEEQSEETTTQDGSDQKEVEKTGDSTADLFEGHIDTNEYQFDWVTGTGVEMADVGGLDEVKEELRQDIVRPMREEPKKAEKFDIPLPNVLLHGPPGTGKTYLAKALAEELGFPFVNLSGSDITSKWVNESADQVGQLFEEAESLAEDIGGAMIFLDELDAVLPERQMDSHEEDRKVVNEFLSHLQKSSRERVLFVGATNKRDDLDSAAVRNGRMDKEIFVGEPDYEARVEIFDAQLDERPHDVTEREIEALAEKTSGVVAADIESLVNQLHATQRTDVMAIASKRETLNVTSIDDDEIVTRGCINGCPGHITDAGCRRRARSGANQCFRCLSHTHLRYPRLDRITQLARCRRHHRCRRGNRPPCRPPPNRLLAQLRRRCTACREIFGLGVTHWTRTIHSRGEWPCYENTVMECAGCLSTSRITRPDYESDSVHCRERQQS